MQLTPSVPIHYFDIDILLRVGSAAMLGLLLGLDRELRGQAAGLRTHGLTCFATSVMTVSLISLYAQLGGADSKMDPLRIFEAVGAFVGIAAAGLIVVTKGEVHNLTTAVNLLLAAVIGIACGAGQWPLVVVAALFGSAIVTLIGYAENRWLKPIVGDPPAAS
ncbi:MAG: MgtC/SapB family protein [Sphingomonadales bacterium]|nr:MgtC/SapB family protein [Sphingomonadales bacterium]